MRRLALPATLALLLAVPAAWSQMRGGMHNAPARAPGMARPSGFVGARPAFISRPHTVSNGGFRHGPSSGSFHGSHGCFNCGHHHFHHGFYPWWWLNAYGYPYGYGAYGYGYETYWPMWDTSSSYDSNADQSYQRDAARQIDDLSRQVQQLREELEAQLYRAPTAQPAPVAAPANTQPQPAPRQQSPMQNDPPSDLSTVLVFRDQRIQEVQNYAIVGKTLVVIANQRQKKIPLSDLDLATTARLNEERGVAFQLPR